MKKIKSYTGIWNVEKVLYAINDFNLPFPVTFTQITWFVIMEMELLKLWYKFHTPKIIILKKSIKKWTIIANNNEDFI